MSWLLSAVVMFVATNIDDLVVLATLFAQPSMRPRHIVAGQLLGFAVIVLLSVLGASGALLFPREWIGVLGLVPLGMGVHSLVKTLRGDRGGDDAESSGEEKPRAGWLAGALSPQILKVVLVTVGNGGDNIGVYIPLFASTGRARMLAVVLVFFVLLGAWCLLGYKLARHPVIAKGIARYGHIVTPLVFIVLGVLILRDSGIVPYLARAMGALHG